MNLLPSAARTTSDVLVLRQNYSNILAGCFLLTVSAAATEAGDLLDVFVQSSDDGTTFDDFIRFTQVLGNGGAKKFRAMWNGLMAPEAELAAPADATMTAGVKQGPVGSLWRVKWVVTDVATLANASFTFKLDASLVRGR